VDHQPRPRVCEKKRRRDRLIRLAQENPDTWVVGFEDETWWSRLQRPSLHSWAEAGDPLRLVEQSVKKDDPDPKAISCYGLYLPEFERVWLRFVDGRPVSSITTRFLEWCSERLTEAGNKKVWLLIWDNASWHISKEVREWIASHNREVKKGGCGVRIISCLLPKKSPWLNPMEPRWVHGKRRVVEPDELLSAQELADRVCSAFDCPHYEHLSIPENVA
jgi:transposase